MVLFCTSHHGFAAVALLEATGPRDGATPPQDTSPREAPPTGWAALGLTYKVQWPLHILFTPAVLEKWVLVIVRSARLGRERQLIPARFCRYNVVFRYLLSVRRVQSQLQHCWALQMQRKHLKSTQTDAVKWRLRNHMAFLIDNLQYYLQVVTHLSALPLHPTDSPFGAVTDVFCCRLCAGGRVGVSVLSAASADQLHQRL